MAYTRTQPASNQLISDGQGTILGNFQYLDSGTTGSTTTNTSSYGTGTGFSTNHFSMLDASYPGMHFMLDFPIVQSADPSTLAGAGAGYAAIYTKSNGTNAEPYFLNAASTSGNAMWYGGTGTTSGAVTPSSASSSSNYLNLPNGIQFRWGTTTGTTAGTAITFGTAFGTGGGAIAIVITPVSTQSRGVAYSGLSRTGFTLYTENNGATVSYFAIGYA